MKRVFDLIVSVSGLLLLSLVFIVVGLLLKISNNGPVLFKQKRIGKNGKIFILYKFRTMKSSTSVLDGSFEPGNTSRVTQIGRFLRKTKIDEFPQLINVLKGNMSLVGPRPEVAKWISVYPERWERILSIKPGITDNSSILFRNEETLLDKSEDPEKTYREIILPKKLDFYEDYVENNSFFGDMKIIYRTIVSVYLNKTFIL